MVTGVWAPEISGGSLQCRSLVHALGGRARVHVLTTTTDATLAGESLVEGIPVRRVLVDPERRASYAPAAGRMARALLAMPSEHRIVHLHGFSQKAILVGLLARARRRRLVVKLTSLGEDDALAMRRRGGLAWRVFRRADAWIAPAPGFVAPHAAAGLPPERLHVIPNGVDVERFVPAGAERRAGARSALKLPPDRRVVLCVGFFSHDKQPDLLLEALLRLPREQRQATQLLFVGATESRYHEVDPAIARGMRDRAEREGVASQLSFVERLDPIEPAYHAADVFVLPSRREGLPNVLIEAMACGLPCIASRLPGSTDAVVEHGLDGLLAEPEDAGALAAHLRVLLADAAGARRLGEAARRSVARRFPIAATADAHLALYRALDA